MKTVINNAMRNAFMNVKVSKESSLTSQILNVLSTKAGTNLEGRGWNFNGSPKTTKELIRQGFLK